MSLFILIGCHTNMYSPLVLSGCINTVPWSCNYIIVLSSVYNMSSLPKSWTVPLFSADCSIVFWTIPLSCVDQSWYHCVLIAIHGPSHCSFAFHESRSSPLYPDGQSFSVAHCSLSTNHRVVHGVIIANHGHFAEYSIYGLSHYSLSTNHREVFCVIIANHGSIQLFWLSFYWPAME